MKPTVESRWTWGAAKTVVARFIIYSLIAVAWLAVLAAWWEGKE